MACSTTWIEIVLLLTLVFVVLSTIISLFVPGLIETPQTASSTIAANNSSARSLLYGAGAVGVIIVILLIVAMVYSWITVNETDPVAVQASYFGYGTIGLALLIFLLIIVMTFLIGYSIGLIDTTNTNTNSTNARWWSVVAVVLLIIALILIFITWFLYYQFNRCLSTLLEVKLPIVIDFKVEKKPFDVGPFTVVRNDKNPGELKNATLTLTGEVE